MKTRVFKWFCVLISVFTVTCLLSNGTYSVELPNLIDQEIKYEKSVCSYLQEYVLDKILGPGKASVIVDVELGIHTTRLRAEAKKTKAKQKKKLAEIEYILPGVPNPKPVSQQTAPGEAEEDISQTQKVEITSKVVIKKQTVTVFHDENIPEEKINIANNTIKAAIKFNKKRGDKIDFKPTPFTRGLMERFLEPKYLLPIVLSLLLLMFLFGPVSSFLKSYVTTLRERGGTEVTVDSKIEGNPGEGEKGAGGGGGTLTPAELESAAHAGEDKHMPFEYINEENFKRLSYLIRKEPPEVIALVSGYLKPEFIRQILTSLPPELQTQVALKLGTIKQWTQKQVMEIDADIKEKIDFLVGGFDNLLKLLDEVDMSTAENILDYLKNEQPEVYERVKKYIITFDDIVNFPDQAVQLIIRELKTENLAKIIRGDCPKEITDKFMANMSQGAQALLKEEIDLGHDLTPAEIAEERRKLLDIVKKLEDVGKIFIREKPKTGTLETIQEEETQSSDEEIQQAQEYLDAGIKLYEEERYEEAIPYFQYCSQIAPNLQEAYQYSGGAYYALGQHNEALSCYEKLQELNPDDENIRKWVEELKTSTVKA